MVDYYTPKDNLDKWLQAKLGVLPGCCSSISEMQYLIARETAEKIIYSLFTEGDLTLKDFLEVYEQLNKRNNDNTTEGR